MNMGAIGGSLRGLVELEFSVLFGEAVAASRNTCPWVVSIRPSGGWSIRRGQGLHDKWATEAARHTMGSVRSIEPITGHVTPAT